MSSNRLVPYVLAAVSLVVLVGLVWFLPVELPLGVRATGRVMPVREWMLVRDTDGNLASVLRDHGQGSVETFAANRFDRGEAIRVTFHTAQGRVRRVEAGDTIATIFSSTLSRERTRLAGEFGTARAEIGLYSTGEKPEVVQGMQRRLEAARERAAQQQRAVERLRPLRERSLASQQEFEEAESLLRVLQADVEAIEAELAAAVTVGREAEIDYARARSEALRRDLEAVEEQEGYYTFRSPLAGRALRSFSPDTLVTVEDTTAYVVILAVPLRERARLAPGMSMRVVVDGLAEPLDGTLLHSGDTVYPVMGEPIVLAAGRLATPPEAILRGTPARCTVIIGNLPVRRYLREVWISAFS